MTSNELNVIEYHNMRVVTTKQLAEAYGTEPRIITNNFTRNKKRFAEGKHFFSLEGEELKLFKNGHHFDDQNGF